MSNPTPPPAALTQDGWTPAELPPTASGDYLVWLDGRTVLAEWWRGRWIDPEDDGSDGAPLRGVHPAHWRDPASIPGPGVGCELRTLTAVAPAAEATAAMTEARLKEIEAEAEGLPDGSDWGVPDLTDEIRQLWAAREADAARAKRLEAELEHAREVLNFCRQFICEQGLSCPYVIQPIDAALAPPVPPQAADAGGGGRGQG